jgi:hypothetical protein
MQDLTVFASIPTVLLAISNGLAMVYTPPTTAWQMHIFFAQIELQLSVLPFVNTRVIWVRVRCLLLAVHTTQTLLA